MEMTTTGKVVVSAQIVNIADELLQSHGHACPEGIRSVEVDDALIDTGATFLSLPTRLIKQLGLEKVGSRAGGAHPGSNVWSCR